MSGGAMEIGGLRNCLLEHARRQPDGIAILCAGRVPLTFRRLAARLQYVVERLGSAGIRRQHRVAGVLAEGAETAVAGLGIACAAAYAPLDPALSSAELEARLAALQADAIVVPHGSDSPAIPVARRRGLQVLELVPQPAAGAGIATLHIHGQSPGNAGPPPGEHDLALLLFTSGTAARPKLVPLTHRNSPSPPRTSVRRSRSPAPTDAWASCPCFTFTG